MKKVIDKIIEDFNFGKVHRVMLALNWRWATTNGVPSIDNLMTRAQEILCDVSKMGTDCSIETGGFKATKIENEDYGEGLKLEFILTEMQFYTKWLDEE